MDHIGNLEQQAIDLARRSDFGLEAKRVNEELAKLAPENGGVWTRLARCCMELTLFDEAMTALDHALQLNPQNTIARSLQTEVGRRRTPEPVRAQRPKRAASTRVPSTPRERATPLRGAARGVPVLGGWGRQEFATLGHLEPSSALDALGPRIEAILMAVADRPFAAKVVEARNRTGQPGLRLYRRNTFRAGGAGHIYAFQHGGQSEPQFNVGFFSARQWGRDAVRAGIGFSTAATGVDPPAMAQQERALAYYESFRRLVASTWRQLLTDWMRTSGGLIQYDAAPPLLDLLPAAAIESLLSADPREHRWIFCGGWLFAERGEDAAILADGTRLVRWIEQTFAALLPLWMTVYRHA